MHEMDQLLPATARAEQRHFWFQGLRRFVSPWLQRATQGLSDVRLVDFGCGTGVNLDLLDRFGRSYGFDVTFVGLQIGRQAGRRRLVQASVSDAPLYSNAFDVVTSFDVLYGLPDPVEKAAVREMFRVIKPGGCILINVAAMDCLKGDHSVLAREIRRYSRASLTRLLTQAGFTIERITYTNASLFVPMLVIRTYQRWRGLPEEAQAETDISVPAAPVNLLLSGILYLESWWLRWFNSPAGGSLLCLARKPNR
ncbi:MAG: class I SAM-dependent methyltransferase [Acidimicrobiia bacterium]|nr:class I SAM-dependent methyltransferase [Acidimicrobiia bacterium]